MYIHPTWGSDYWTWLLIAVFVAFIAPEVYALFTSDANTLSDYARWQLDEYRNEPVFMHDAQWWISQVIFLGLIAWLWGHIWYYVWG